MDLPASAARSTKIKNEHSLSGARARGPGAGTCDEQLMHLIGAFRTALCRRTMSEEHEDSALFAKLPGVLSHCAKQVDSILGLRIYHSLVQVNTNRTQQAGMRTDFRPMTDLGSMDRLVYGRKLIVCVLEVKHA
eukprot:6185210-Pleurochrysis_carterae.AAC.1